MDLLDRDLVGPILRSGFLRGGYGIPHPRPPGKLPPPVMIPHLWPRQWLHVLDLASASWEVAPESDGLDSLSSAQAVAPSASYEVAPARLVVLISHLQP